MRPARGRQTREKRVSLAERALGPAGDERRGHGLGLKLKRSCGVLCGNGVRAGEQQLVRRGWRSSLELKCALHAGERRPLGGGAGTRERLLGKA